MSTDPFTVGTSPVPLPNSYWVRPSQLLAGEYPGSMSRSEATERVQKLLHAGVNSFIDLTEEGELPAYEPLLAELSEQHIRYRRTSILDHGLPDSPADMSRILDLIDSELAAGRCIYIHCRAGIGRTGTTVGCHLVRSGLSGEAALDRLQDLWQQCGRSRRWPTIPETDEQVQFVRLWRESAAVPEGNADVLSRYEASLVGLAIGDALGSLVANSHFDAATLVAGGSLRDAGTFVTGASTAMTRALAESLLLKGVNDSEDQMQRYLSWTQSVGNIGVPPEVRRALAGWQWSRKKLAGSHDPANLDPHSLPRTLAVAMFLRADAQTAIDAAVEASRTTQQSPVVLDLCRVWTALFVDAYDGVNKQTLLSLNGPAMQLVRQRQLKPQVKQLLESRGSRPCTDAHDALSVTCVALDGFAAGKTLHDVAIRVLTSSRAAPSAAALAGALCGAYHGSHAITPELQRQLPEEALLRSLARHLMR
ncbi:ADP-ribosylglycohydrolase family protein [Steroidobacter sp.]|uniref:ADP-ribosylglycohydrolase family protein n=1 Tax=Steroidobacter sp. TaxID=1978227 RepID=UPI001A611787|nr:ADP-ribosylglycohydrolase family protein [Steroidobacter sp.]MBL8264932.1 ADP-ribosylglycohydrolase family protein [Steroidobacter sp.]